MRLFQEALQRVQTSFPLNLSLQFLSNFIDSFRFADWIFFQQTPQCFINENNFPIESFPGKFKQSKSDEFFHDFDLYSAPGGNGQPSTVGFQLPDIFQTIGHESGPNFNFKESDKADFWLKSGENRSEKRVHDVTNHLATIYKNKRMQVFHNMARTRAALRSKEFFRLYTSPSSSIIGKKSQRTSKLRTRLQKPKKPFSYQMEYEKLRGLRESEEELAKVQAYINTMIAKNIKKFEDEKKKQQLMVEKVEYHYPTLQELVTRASINFSWPQLFRLLAEQATSENPRAEETQAAHKQRAVSEAA